MDIKKGIKHLCKVDKQLAIIIKEYPKPKINETKFYFQSLVRNIVYQQLSTKSAFAIHSRFKKLFSSPEIKPAEVTSMPIDKLKAIGLSKQKN
jgi:DNA-3-methyladenine glycosylase II